MSKEIIRSKDYSIIPRRDNEVSQRPNNNVIFMPRRPIVLYKKKEEKKYNFTKNEYNTTTYNNTTNNNNLIQTPEVVEGDGFIITMFKLVGVLFGVLRIGYNYSYMSLTGHKQRQLSLFKKKDREIRRRVKQVNKIGREI